MDLTSARAAAGSRNSSTNFMLLSPRHCDDLTGEDQLEPDVVAQSGHNGLVRGEAPGGYGAPAGWAAEQRRESGGVS